MRSHLIMSLLFSLVLGLFSCGTQGNEADLFSRQLRDLKIGSNFRLLGFIQPSFLDADFNGDGHPDRAFTIVEKKTGKKGILVLHGSTRDYFVLGAGTPLDGDDNFRWAHQWRLFTEKVAYETQFDEETGDIQGGKEVPLQHPAILIEQVVDGVPLAGGIIHWNGNQYQWIHQGE